jgi:hypothetical protein
VNGQESVDTNAGVRISEKMRKIFFFAVAILILGSAQVTEAEAQKLVRIGYLDLSMRSTSPGPLDAFRHE